MDVDNAALKRAGMVGAVTDCVMHDLEEIRLVVGNLRFFTRGVSVSHAIPSIPDSLAPIELAGCAINLEYRLHGDHQGVAVIPNSIAVQVAASAKAVRSAEVRAFENLRAGISAEGVTGLIRPARNRGFEEFAGGPTDMSP